MNCGTHLVIEEFKKGESKDSILEKLKNMFELNHDFININDDEICFSEGEDGTIYNSRMEEVFYKNFNQDMTALEIKDLVEKIGKELVSYDSEAYDDFNLVYMGNEDKITLSISILLYFL